VAKKAKAYSGCPARISRSHAAYAESAEKEVDEEEEEADDDDVDVEEEPTLDAVRTDCM
jgi:hypothetical protein